MISIPFGIGLDSIANRLVCVSGVSQASDDGWDKRTTLNLTYRAGRPLCKSGMSSQTPKCPSFCHHDRYLCVVNDVLVACLEHPNLLVDPLYAKWIPSLIALASNFS